jgi:hypothetical protein
MLDDLELPQVQEIAVHERRILAEHKPPGMAGSLLQNMGRRPSHVTLWGVVTGPEATAFVEELDARYRAGDPVPFVADVLADAEIEQMVIDDLQWQEVAGRPQRFSYVLTLREYIEPVEPEDTSLLDQDILDEAQDLIGDLVEGLDIGLAFATGLERFVSPLGDLLARLRAVNQNTEGGGGG